MPQVSPVVFTCWPLERNLSRLIWPVSLNTNPAWISFQPSPSMSDRVRPWPLCFVRGDGDVALAVRGALRRVEGYLDLEVFVTGELCASRLTVRSGPEKGFELPEPLRLGVAIGRDLLRLVSLWSLESSLCRPRRPRSRHLIDDPDAHS